MPFAVYVEVPMTRTIAIATFLVVLAVSRPIYAGEPAASLRTPRPTRPVHTYSIVARDPKTGELGVAVQSHWFAIGPLVPWVEAGVGAIATQSFVDSSYGPDGFRRRASCMSSRRVTVSGLRW